MPEKLNNGTIIGAVDAWTGRGTERFGQCFMTKEECQQKYGHISDWDVSDVTRMTYLFMDCKNFNDDITRWDVSNVREMYNMFQDAHSFNQPIGCWNVSNVINFSAMLRGAKSFNQPLNDWDLSNAASIHRMFVNCKAFNQPLDKWGTYNFHCGNVFEGATSFNQSLESRTVEDPMVDELGPHYKFGRNMFGDGWVVLEELKVFRKVGNITLAKIPVPFSTILRTYSSWCKCCNFENEEMCLHSRWYDFWEEERSKVLEEYPHFTADEFCDEMRGRWKIRDDAFVKEYGPYSCEELNLTNLI